jgi:hypothetical protein
LEEEKRAEGRINAEFAETQRAQRSSGERENFSRRFVEMI